MRFDPLPPKEALAWWRTRVPITITEFKDLSAGAKAQAFTVSGVAKLDQVAAVHRALEQALAEGRPLGEFQREMNGRLGGKLSGYRLETVYRTNIQTAYQVGRWAQLGEVTKNMPWWRYVAVGDSRTRPTHRAMHGLVRRHDDPFWDMFYPPNGFRCRCTVQPLSPRQVAKKGYETGEGIPDVILWTDPDTGMEYPIVPLPDRGFATNVAKEAYHPDLSGYRADMKQATLTAIGTACREEGCYPQVKRFLAQGDLDDMETAMWAADTAHKQSFSDWVDGVLAAKQPKGELYPVGNLPGRVLRKMTPQPRLALVTIDDKQLTHMARDTKAARGAALSAEELRTLPEKLAKADWYRDTEKSNYLFAWVRAEKDWLKVVVEPDYRIDKRKDLVANHIVTGGVTRETNLAGGNYEKL